MSLIALMLALATPTVAQQTAKPTDDAAAKERDADQANRAALSTTASQTARIIGDRDANARNLAAYEEAKANYARSLASYEAEKAAVARKTADDAEAYQRQLSEWQGSVKHGPTPVLPPPPVAAAAKAPPRRHCTYEQPTGSNFPVRVCR